MTEQLARQVVNLFGDAFFNNYDYITSRNSVWYVLTRTCEISYNYSSGDQNAQDEYQNCMSSQADFYFSMTPESGSTEPSSWGASLGYQAPWGGTLSFSYSSSGIEFSNWVSDLLEEIASLRTCHNWFQALEAANCPIPNLNP